MKFVMKRGARLEFSWSGLRCVECGQEWNGAGEWSSFRCGDDRVELHCPECIERRNRRLGRRDGQLVAGCFCDDPLRVNVWLSREEAAA